MTQLFGGVFSYVSFLILFWAGTVHLVNIRHLVGALKEQGLWPTLLVPFVAISLTAAEVGIGGVGVVSILYEYEESRSVALTAAAGLYVCFLVYAAVLWLWRPSAPCGCSATSSETSATGWIVARAGLLMLSSLGALLLLRDQALVVWPDWHRGVTMSAAALSLCVIVWNIPMTIGTPLSLRRETEVGF